MSVVRFRNRDISRCLLRFLEAENACEISAVEFELLEEVVALLAQSHARLLRFDDRIMVVETPEDHLVRFVPMEHVVDVRIEPAHTSPADQTQ